jgi:two-component sensor histidine kinase
MLESHLYLDPDIERIDLAIYVMELLGKLVSFHSDSVEQIRLDTNLTQVHVTPSQAEALGLVTNEFVMNSFKHAFSQSGGTLRVELSHDDKTAIFTIADDGPGFEQGVGEEGLGLRLMTAFVKQIGAELELIGDSGTRLTITWPLK